ncbi:hypothetical protein [Salidesulfovibrio onnuriiensis]|uniref:hypothetical protein n=1 Tax=Salidesulfovibrio onnuriiensis TaxID=2583823 RepID=UPI0011CAF55A|nr:hypothetical protein [Salidesulfovibrio onnuriiensis]
MQVVLDGSRISGLLVSMDVGEAGESTVFRGGDVVDLSEEAVALFEESAREAMYDSAMSLEEFDKRIAVIRGEIAAVWNGPLPDDEKYRQISSKENEIALLQAGQFTFARAGFYKAV